MELNEVKFGEQPPIDGYGPDFFRIGGTVFSGAVLVSSAGVTEWEGLSNTEALIRLGAEVDVLFLGMGADIAQLPEEARQRLDHAKVPYEIMSSPAAARTYNVLLSEERRVAVALLPV